MNKKVLLITSYPLNNEPVIRNRLLPFITVAIEKGYKVIVTSPDDKVFIKAGLEFTHVLSPDLNIKPTSFVKRFFFEFKQSRRLLKAAKFIDSDLTLVTIPSMFLLFNVHLLKSEKLILDIRDLVWEYISDSNFINRIAKSLFKRLARINLKRASVILATNSDEIEYLKNFNIGNKHILHVTNGVSAEQFNKLSVVTSNGSTKQTPSVAYIGNVGLAQDLTCLIDVAISMPDVTFYIVGEGTDYPAIKQYVTKNNVNNVMLLGRISWDEVINVYNKVDILYAQLTPDFASAMPSKLYEYLSTGKYIIYGGMEQAESILKQFTHNTVIPPSDRQALKQALEHVIQQGFYRENNQANKDIVKSHFIREDSVNKVFNYFEK